MGFLYTTQGTQRVLDTLNTAFNDSSGGLAYIRGLLTSVPQFNGYLRGRGFKLDRLARVLQIYPADQSPTHAPVDGRELARWTYFLRKTLFSNARTIHD